MSLILKRYTKQLILLGMILLTTVVLASYITSEQLSKSLTDIYVEKLKSLENTLKVSIENYFEQKSSIVKTIAKTKDTKNAIEEFSQVFNNISKEYGSITENKKLISLIDEHTKRVFYNIPNSPVKKPLKEYIASDKNGNILQKLYVANNPFISFNKHMYFNSNLNLSYDKVHKKYHKHFVDILMEHSFYDIFLIDGDGNIIYSVYKELDLGTNLKNGVYSKSSLAIAYKQALKTGKLAFSDFKPYEPSYNKPASFFAIPIIKEDKTLGAIAFQISIKEIDNIMTFDESWEDIGLGNSGESYIVGNDYLMRSDSRFISSIKDSLINGLSTTVGVLNVKSQGVQKALNGEINQGVNTDYRGIKVLGVYSPIKVADETWALVVEIDQSEVDGEIYKIVATILTTGIVLVVLSMMFFGYILLRMIIRPIENFEKELDNKVQKKTQELKKSNAVLNNYKKAVDEGAIVSKTDPEGIIKYVNDAFCEISGYTRDELIGKPHNIVRHPDNLKAVFEELWRTIQNRRIWKGIVKNQKKDGSEYIVKSTIVPMLDDKNNITEYISIRTDISKLVSKEKKLLEQTTDELTKLPNRIKLFEDISSNSSELKLAILEIDRFKEINDFYGYEKGNLILISLASILQRIVSDNSSIIYRVGSSEYAILSNGNITMEEFIKSIENIIKYCDHNIIVVESDSFNISMQVGVAKGSKSKLFFNAEMALRKAVDSSKSLVAFKNTDNIENDFENNILMTKKIKEAIKNNNILVYGQPIKTNFDGGKSKYECLIRMYDKDEDKVLSPFFFLDISKKARLYPTLTKIIIETSFEYFKDKKDEFSINLSIEDVLSDDIVTFLKKKIDYYKIGHRLVLELVESEGIENFEDVYAFIQEFKGYGCKIAIDDFGTGYSNFEYLMKLDVDYIKIDGSLIKNIDTDKSAEVVVELVIDFAKKLNIKTIAEFIHNDAVYQKVKSMGVDYSQGYHLGEPKALNEIP